METLTLISIVSALLVISVESTDNDGISSYCEKSRRYSFWYVATPDECCDYRGKCDRVIGPRETKYGLTNPEANWSRRHCSCDVELYKCVTKNLTFWSLSWAEAWGFGSEICFIESAVKIGGKPFSGGYEFWHVMDIVNNEKSKSENRMFHI